MKIYGFLTYAAIFLFVISGCSKVNEDTAWNDVIEGIAGQYSVTEIRIAEEGRAMDLDGDGSAHHNLLEEFRGLPNFGLYFPALRSNVTRAASGDRTGYINLNIPIQGIYERNGMIIPEWLLGGNAYARVQYTVNDGGTIITEDLHDLGTYDPNRPDLNTMSDLHVSFSGSGEMDLEVSCMLYDFQTTTAEKLRLNYRFSRI